MNSIIHFCPTWFAVYIPVQGGVALTVVVDCHALLSRQYRDAASIDVGAKIVCLAGVAHRVQ